VLPPCLGLGLVRAVDVEHQILYILSPLPLSVVKACNVLLQASSSLHAPLLMTHSRVGLPTTYLSCEVSTTGEGATHLRPRMTMARRREREESGGGGGGVV